jgi:hypothetical protein
MCLFRKMLALYLVFWYGDNVTIANFAEFLPDHSVLLLLLYSCLAQP